MQNTFVFARRNTNTVTIGNIAMGSSFPVRIQTMTNTPPTDVAATVAQIKRTVAASTEIIRLAITKPADIEALKEIIQQLRNEGYQVPIVIDIHFNARLAMEVAPLVEKVRINPGNFIDKKRFNELTYTDDEYEGELRKVEETFVPLIDLCKEHKTALRIGTNHGSLSDRIMSRYGDTPEGMAEASMEFLRICQKEHFDQVVISMKASNTRIMVYATRLLVAKMQEEQMNYPIHLGVTEAGEGEDGRIKSAVGIGALMNEGIGDTIRVSLTEDPEAELPVAQLLARYFESKGQHLPIPIVRELDPVLVYSRRLTHKIANIGGDQIPVVLAEFAPKSFHPDQSPDYLLTSINVERNNSTLPIAVFHPPTLGYATANNEVVFRHIFCHQVTNDWIASIQANEVIILGSQNQHPSAELKYTISRFDEAGCRQPVIIHLHYSETDKEVLQLKAAADAGILFIDGVADGIFITNALGGISQRDLAETSFGILQASRVRTTKTEYISCPSCGRTLFNLQETTAKVRARTSHLKGLKIGIMGCIVNGPGEMADADYGYVGAGKGRITLYKKRNVVKKNIPEEFAVDELIGLIKENNDWVEPQL